MAQLLAAGVLTGMGMQFNKQTSLAGNDISTSLLPAGAQSNSVPVSASAHNPNVNQNITRTVNSTPVNTTIV